MPGVWTVPATVVEVVDGATVTLNLSLGWDIWTMRTCRLVGCIAPSPGAPEGDAEVRRLKELLARLDGNPLVFVSLDYGTDRVASGQLLGSTPQGYPVDVSAEMMPQ